MAQFRAANLLAKTLKCKNGDRPVALLADSRTLNRT